MAIRASREVVIDAPPEAIIAALAYIQALPSWSSVHQRAEMIDTYLADGAGMPCLSALGGRYGIAGEAACDGSQRCPGVTLR